MQGHPFTFLDWAQIRTMVKAKAGGKCNCIVNTIDSMVKVVQRNARPLAGVLLHKFGYTRAVIAIVHIKLYSICY